LQNYAFDEQNLRRFNRRKKINVNLTRSMEHGAWSMGHGAWSMERRAEGIAETNNLEAESGNEV
jgi:hypothetical protein